jgi:hypothetical protein
MAITIAQILDGIYPRGYDDPEVLPKYSHCPGSGFSSRDSQLERNISNGTE